MSSWIGTVFRLAAVLMLGAAVAFSVFTFGPKEAAGGGLHTDVSTISGDVIFIGTPPGPIVIEVYERPQFSPRPVSSARVDQSGPYQVQVRPGAYYLRAFVDSNRNLQWDSNEPVGVYSAEQALVIVPLASKNGINILIPLPKGSTEKQQGNH